MAPNEITKNYIETIGRRKTAVARVRATESSRNSLSVNERDAATYFRGKHLYLVATDPIAKAKLSAKFKITAQVKGGGSTAQAEAVRHGIARALVAFDAEQRKRLKKMGFLKRDPRMKERRKFGLKKARKAAQWSKR